MDPEQIGYLVGVLVGALFVGCVLGVVPLLMGLKQKRNGLAWSAFGVTVLSSFILGIILALPVMIIFTVVLWVTRKKATAEVPPMPKAGSEG
ncbi:hypothetical protein P3T73_09075 [Kiritimatiellota bacterium B12222]|nr:hypothetical protein P3T73_09075 [Kiritimatiellota bacterium B12222]